VHVAGISHVALTVTDIERARTFWTEVMGFEAAAELPGLLILVDTHARTTIACLTHEAGDPGPFDECHVGLDHLALQVDGIEELRAWEARLDEAGVSFSPIVESPWGAHLNVRGPENLAIELLAMKPEVLGAMYGQGGTAQDRLQALGG
jgi:glyoxylase I family protein